MTIDSEQKMLTLMVNGQTQNSPNYQVDAGEIDVTMQEWSLHDRTFLKYSKVYPYHAPMYMDNQTMEYHEDYNH